ncbi:MAG TPA: glutamate 5-kinase [bacterium]|nr:glutamate 5-kinase [bacterium]HQQ00215.1 glutamate 5-kinase [bacterium]
MTKSQSPFELPSEIRNDLKKRMAGVRRVIVKLGTRVIDHPQTRFNAPVAVDLAHDIADLRAAGIEVVMVSSGAVGLGMRLRNENRRPRKLAQRQAYAALGQSELMHQYREIFRIYGIQVAQVLLTRRDLDERTSYLNARESLNELLRLGALPIINENDTVAVDELRFSDNDMLAALLAGKIEADLLAILTVVDGLYADDAEQRLIPFVRPQDEDLLANAKESDSYRSLGGMRAKIQAAKTACAAGVLTVITNGTRPRILSRLWQVDAPATWMVSSQRHLAGRKHWIGFGKQPSGGRIRIDAGAVAALCEQGRSLLARGVTAVIGGFSQGDLVEIEDEAGRIVARGLVHYDSTDMQKICQKNSAQIKKILRIDSPPEVIHRDDLVIL